MEAKYKNIYEEIEKELEDVASSISKEDLLQNIKNAIKTRVDLIHKELDEAKENLINKSKLALDNQLGQLNEDPEKNKENETKKSEANKPGPNTTEVKKTKPKEPEKELTALQKEFANLTTNIVDIKKSMQQVEQIMAGFKETKFDSIIQLDKNNFKFKMENKLNMYANLNPSNSYYLKWAEEQNKPTTCDISQDDEFTLNVHSSSCYTYYALSPPIKDINVVVVFETNISKSDGYFYFGVVKKSTNMASSCMCCNIAGATYIRSTGNVIEKSSTIYNDNLKYMSELNTIKVDFNYINKEVYFTVNDGDAQGPYSIPDDDEEYLITSGSCNSANGYITIKSSNTY